MVHHITRTLGWCARSCRAHSEAGHTRLPPSHSPAVTVTWQEVWFFNVTQLVVVAHLRLALDDENPSVAAAAAGALAAVVSWVAASTATSLVFRFS